MTIKGKTNTILTVFNNLQQFMFTVQETKGNVILLKIRPRTPSTELCRLATSILQSAKATVRLRSADNPLLRKSAIQLALSDKMSYIILII